MIQRSFPNLNQDNVRMYHAENLAAYVIRLDCNTPDNGRMLVRQYITYYTFHSWGIEHQERYVNLFVDKLIDSMFYEIYYTHGQGD